MKIELTGVKILSDLSMSEKQSIIKELTLNNPKYHMLKQMGKWTIEPKTLSFYEERGDTIIVPREFGWYPQTGIADVLDNRITAPIDFPDFQGKLRDYQIDPYNAILSNDSGVVVAPAGSGKTTIGLAAMAERKQKSLVIVNTQTLFDQWGERAKEFLGIRVGRIGGGSWDTNSPVVIATMQTLISDKKMLADFGKEVGLVVSDEGHHAPCDTITEVLECLPAKYRIGLTATPTRGDGLTAVIHWLLGPIICEVDREAASAHLIQPELVVQDTELLVTTSDHNKLQKRIMEDEYRNTMIVDDVEREAESGGRCVVLGNRINHLKDLSQRLKGRGITVALITGSTQPTERTKRYRQMEEGKISTLVATTKLLGEGFDCPTLNRLFLAAPFGSKPLVEQCVGRVMRPDDGKEDAVVYDYRDRGDGMIAGLWYKRWSVYKKLGLVVREGRKIAEGKAVRDRARCRERD